MQKIVHVIISCSYVEDAGYQENILPRKHKQLGYDVAIISKSTYYDKEGKPRCREACTYINNDCIPVTILPNSKNTFWSKISRGRLYFMDRVTDGLFEKLEAEKPDIIFVHGVSVSDTKDVAKYVKSHKDVRLFFDQHGDYYNTPIKSNSLFGTFFLVFRHKVYMRNIVRRILPYVNFFWGTTPWRVQYLQDVYRVPSSKCGLLMMGGDETYIKWERKDEIRSELRKEWNISKDDYVIITGGKIDRNKNIQLLVEAVKRIDNPKVKLLIFGSSTNEMTSYLNVEKNNFINIGWLHSNSVYDWFLASDMAVFPGTHSVLWEQAAATGIPMICKYWAGMQHINYNGNCVFIKEDNVNIIMGLLSKYIYDNKQYSSLLESASKARIIFQYATIAKQSISR